MFLLIGHSEKGPLSLWYYFLKSNLITWKHQENPNWRTVYRVPNHFTSKASGSPNTRKGLHTSIIYTTRKPSTPFKSQEKSPPVPGREKENYFKHMQNIFKNKGLHLRKKDFTRMLLNLREGHVLHSSLL